MIEISSGGLCPSNSKKGVFPNYAGPRCKEKDEEIEKELLDAGIEPNRSELWAKREREVETDVIGFLESWSFERAWYYWVASGPGIPPQYANPLHEKFGNDVRVAGHCGCPSPKEWFKGFAVGSYHVDTPEGLKALADTIKKIVEDAKE
jgi:hypothetical protein